MTSGKVKAINERGFGFISGEDGKDYFFHRQDLETRPMFDALSVGDVVEFSAVEPAPPKGPRAQSVRYPAPREVSING